MTVSHLNCCPVFGVHFTPESEAAELGGTIYSVVTSPAFVQWTSEQGISPAVRATPNEIGTFWAEETKRYLDLAKVSGVDR